MICPRCEKEHPGSFETCTKCQLELLNKLRGELNDVTRDGSIDGYIDEDGCSLQGAGGGIPEDRRGMDSEEEA